MDKPTSQKWRSFTPARSGKMVHYCSGDWRSFAPALTTATGAARHKDMSTTQRYIDYNESKLRNAIELA
jgi:hypothetical protein